MSCGKQVLTHPIWALCAGQLSISNAIKCLVQVVWLLSMGDEQKELHILPKAKQVRDAAHSSAQKTRYRPISVKCLMTVNNSTMIQCTSMPG